MSPRCYLFVPGDRSDMLAKAATRGADALIVDLEDAVAPSMRDDAVGRVAAWLRTGDHTNVEVWVRLPPGEPAETIETIAEARPTGFVIPKAETADHVAAMAADAGGPGGHFPPRLIVLIETPRGLQQADAIATVPGVERLMSGEMDLGAALGIDPRDPEAWWPIRSRIVVASAAADLAGPIGPVSADFSDPHAIEQSARTLRRHGFRAGAAIHPSQVAPYMRAFAALPDEIAAATRLVDLYEAALALGQGAVVDDRGQMVDEAIVKAARRLIAEAGDLA